MRYRFPLHRFVAAALAGMTAGEARAQDTGAVISAAVPGASQSEVLLGGRIEVTQGVQSPANAVPLVGGRPAWVRVYLSPGTPAPLAVIGKLRVQTVERLDTLLSAGVAALSRGDALEGRDRIDGSLNFFLPPELAGSGSAVLELVEVRDAVTRAPVVCSDCAAGAKEVVFSTPTVLRLKVIGFRYRSRRLEPSNVDFEALHTWLWRAFPVSAVEMDWVIMDALDATPTCDEINVQLVKIRNLDLEGGQDPRVRYYGMVRDAGRFHTNDFMPGCSMGIPDAPDASVVASGPAGRPFANESRFSWDRDPSYADWVGGHELAHTLGRRHPGWCQRQRRDDPMADTADGGRIGTDEESNLAVDLFSLDLLGHDRWHDIMTYCRWRWISGRTYAAILARLQQEDIIYRDALPQDPEDPSESPVPPVPAADALSAGQDSLLNVLVKFSDVGDSTGRIMGVFTTAVRGRPAALDQSVLDTISPGRLVIIELADGKGKVWHPAWIMLNRSEVGDGAAGMPLRAGVGFVNAFVPNLPGAGWVRVLRDGVMVDETPKSASAPVLERASHVLFSSNGETVAHEFEWETADPDDPGERQTYYVQIALDERGRWDTIQQTRARLFRLKCDLLRGRKSARLRIIASDGVNHRVVYETGELVRPINDPCSPDDPGHEARRPSETPASDPSGSQTGPPSR